jgi:hypothetical protein
VTNARRSTRSFYVVVRFSTLKRPAQLDAAYSLTFKRP